MRAWLPASRGFSGVVWLLGDHAVDSRSADPEGRVAPAGVVLVNPIRYRRPVERSSGNRSNRTNPLPQPSGDCRVVRLMKRLERLNSGSPNVASLCLSNAKALSGRRNAPSPRVRRVSLPGRSNGRLAFAAHGDGTAGEHDPRSSSTEAEEEDPGG